MGECPSWIHMMFLLRFDGGLVHKHQTESKLFTMYSHSAWPETKWGGFVTKWINWFHLWTIKVRVGSLSWHHWTKIPKNLSAYCKVSWSDRTPRSGPAFSQSQVISESMCSHRWRGYKLIGCWNKWHASCSKTGLWQIDKLSFRRHRQPAWVELRRTRLHRCNFPRYRLVSLWIFVANWT